MVAIVLWTRVCVGVWVFRMVAVGGVVWGLFVPLVVLVWVGVVAPVWVVGWVVCCVRFWLVLREGSKA